ncbi:hypothetical protein GGR42_003171 [Saonia flava]|uniref:DUF2059 domain-containing protein n=1 Tax=Saonia flava TaxID=523696 RepID=A0A846R0J5_9FLAO|nr:DUF2059 domain-containing protein [Saonia flava]NJB72680.1 hypothetical protein [Saonia flava]
MKKIKIILTISLLTLLGACAQDDYSENVAQYLESNGTKEQYEYAYDELLKMLKTQYPKTEENKKGWDFLEENKEKSVSDMLTVLVPIYTSHFTKDEVKTMLNFYQSAAGKQLVLDRSKMTESQKSAFTTYNSTELGKKIAEKQGVLSTEISTASEGWSRDLYETAVSLLKQ